MGEAKRKDKEMKTFKEISQGLKTKYYKKAVATNRHGNTQMKVDTARFFGGLGPDAAKKLKIEQILFVVKWLQHVLLVRQRKTQMQ